MAESNNNEKKKKKGKSLTKKLIQKGKEIKAIARTGRARREFPSLGHSNRVKKNDSSADSAVLASSQNTPEQSSTSTSLTTHSSSSESARRWFASFARSDPRQQIARFFFDLAQEGADNIESGEFVASPTPDILPAFPKASVFTVWRPTSFVAIRRMIAGEATGKGLEIKAKSSRHGRLSGFVPYLQIDKEEDKKRVCTLPRGGRTRIFFAAEKARDEMVAELKPYQNQMMNAVSQAKLLLRDTAVTGLTPFSAASRLAVSGLRRPIGKQLSRASGMAAAAVESSRRSGSFKAVSKTVSKASNVASSAKNPLRKSLTNGSEKSDDSTAPVAKARKSILRASMSGENRSEPSKRKVQDADDERERALTRLLFDMDDPSIKIIDKYAPECFGIELPDRLLWKACVVDRDISRPEGSEFYTGRASEPAFQDLNFKAVWKTQKQRKKKSSSLKEPRVVLWQTLSVDVDPDDDPTDPRGLIMAYEENGGVLPVVSDFDCFTVGTRSVQYETPLPKEQAELVEWEVSQIEGILDKQALANTPLIWTACWLNVLKAHAAKGFSPNVPRFGFGDAKSYSIMECAVSRLSSCGAVRHGAECFNYFFPQELDEEFLIVSDMLPGNVPWKYVDVKGIQEFLCERIDEGYTIPLNPKWVLCDLGWKQVYDRLMQSDKANVQESLNVWFPPESGIRERIESIHDRHPRGFIQAKRTVEMTGTEAMDLATLELDRYLALRRAKMKLRAVVAFNDLLVSVRKKNGERPDDAVDTVADGSDSTIE